MARAFLRAFSAEVAKMRHAAPLRLALLAPLPLCLFVAFSGLSGRVSFSLWNYWYVLLMPICIALIAACSAWSDARMGNRAMLGCGVPVGAQFASKAAYCLGLSLLSNLMVFAGYLVGVVLAGQLGGQGAAFALTGAVSMLAAAIAVTATSAWMVPAVLLLTMRRGLLVGVAAPSFLQLAGAFVWWAVPCPHLFPPTATAVIPTAFIPVLPSGEPLAAGMDLPASLSPGGGLVWAGIVWGLVLYWVLTALGSAWAARSQELGRRGSAQRVRGRRPVAQRGSAGALRSDGLCGSAVGEPRPAAPRTDLAAEPCPAVLRMGFAGAFRSEALRLLWSPLVSLHIACALFAAVVCGAYFSYAVWDPALGADAYVQFLGALMPLMAGIVCGISIESERDAGGFANLLGAPSCGRAIVAKTVVLWACGAASLALAVCLFFLVVQGFRGLPFGGSGLACAVAGLALGSLPFYVLSVALALRFGRNAAIGVGAVGLLFAFFSVGGLAHGLMTGSFTGIADFGIMGWVPFGWSARLGSMGVEASIAGIWGDAALSVQVAQAASGLVRACIALAVVSVLLLVWWFGRFQPGRKGV